MKKFSYGSHNNPLFRYVGSNIERNDDGLMMDQDHYVRKLEQCDTDTAVGKKLDDVLGEDDQGKFRSLAAKLAMLSIISRPDIAFESKLFTMKYGKATKRDLRDANKKLKFVKNDTTRMVYPGLGCLQDWIIVGLSDAAVNSMPDKVGSVGGQVVLLVNKKSERTCVLGWRSKQLHRVVHSSLVAEALSLLELFGDLKYTSDQPVQLSQIGHVLLVTYLVWS